MRLPRVLERLGTALVVLLTVLTLLGVGLVSVLKMAASDLHLQVDISRGAASPTTRSPLGLTLSELLAGDIPLDSYAELDVRGDDLDHGSDRVLEATAVVALVGMLVGLLAMPPASHGMRAGHEANSPLTNTSRKGRV
jgi:hypothetical protein